MRVLDGAVAGSMPSPVSNRSPKRSGVRPTSTTFRICFVNKMDAWAPISAAACR